MSNQNFSLMFFIKKYSLSQVKVFVIFCQLLMKINLHVSFKDMQYRLTLRYL